MPDARYFDDPTIRDDVDLLRRIHPSQIVPHKNIGGVLRPSSAAFRDSTDGTPMSVVLADVLQASGRQPEAILDGFSGYVLTAFSAGHARRCQQGIQRDPQPDEPAHAYVFGPKTDGIRRRLAEGVRWVAMPT